MGTVKLVRNAINNRFTYNCRWIGFDGEGFCSFESDSARNLVIFGVDNGSSSHNDNRKNNFLILGKGPTFGINSNHGAENKKLVLTLVKQIQHFP